MLFVFNKFKRRKWIKYNTQKRLKIYQAVEKKFAKKQKREPLEVVVHPNDNWQCLGMFSVSKNQSRILINNDLLVDISLRFHGLETIIHEGRHAYQYEIINKKLPWYAFRAKRWRKNWEGYIPSAENSVVYNAQEVEQDAQKYALTQMLKLKRKYKNDNDWEQTIAVNKYRLEHSQDQARKEYGIFYKHKINRIIKNKAKDKEYY